jgi:hypothetical protein
MTHDFAAGANPDQGPLPPRWAHLCQLVAAAADLCLVPQRHAVRPVAPTETGPEADEWCLRIQPRRPDGQRLSEGDIELEIFRSGEDLHLMMGWPERPEQPLLWHGQHTIWMDGGSGMRCAAPPDGGPLEALARRLRALLADQR